MTSGILLALFGCAVIAWIIYDFDYSSLSGGEFLQALLDPRIPVEPELFTPQVWALTAALLVVGVMALGQRPAARGAALFVAWVLLAVAARELVGLLVSDGFRDHYMGGNDLDELIIGSWVAALVFSLAVLIMMLPTGGPGTTQPADPSAPLAAAGALLLFLGVVGVAWTVRQLTSEKYALDAGDYFRHLVDASHVNGPSAEIGGSGYLYQALFTLAMLVLGVLALAGRPVARAGAATLAAVVLYLGVRRMIGLTLGDGAGFTADDDRWYPSWSLAGSTVEGKLDLATTVGESVACVALLILLAVAGRRVATGPAWQQPGYPPGPQGYAPFGVNPYQSPQPGYGAAPGYPQAPPAPPSYPPSPGV